MNTQATPGSRIDPSALLCFNDPPAGRAFYHIGGITIEVQSGLPIASDTFNSKFRAFAADGPGDDNIVIRHRFGLPDIASIDLGTELHNRPPWIVSATQHALVHQCVVWPGPEIVDWIVSDLDCSRIVNFHRDDRMYAYGNWHSLSLAPTDQIFLARALASRQACYIHSAGAVLNAQGLLFVGHSEAGKSTTVNMLKGRAEILCDDRVILRRHSADATSPEVAQAVSTACRDSHSFRIHGTWSHGDVPDVSSASAPLRAIFFLKQSARNRATPLPEVREIFPRLLACLIKPLVTGDWFRQSAAVLAHAAAEVPCYELEFDKSGAIVPLLEDLVA